MGDTLRRVEFGGTVLELAQALEELVYPGKGEKRRGDYWVEVGPYTIGGPPTEYDHSYFQVIVIDDENQRIYLEV